MDNDANFVRFPSLILQPGETLHYQIDHIGGTGALGIFVYPWQAPADEPIIAPDGPKPGVAPELILFNDAISPSPALVYSDRLVDIYQLCNPAPYFEATGGDCTLSPHGRSGLHSICGTRAHLIRRELFFPGWRARVNGVATDITPAGEIFQQIDLPAGSAEIRFSYAPPHILWAYVCAVAGVLALGAGLPWSRLPHTPAHSRI